ncbi:MAG: substrate-binding domain-containing protein [Parasporobacterium sp.]|nr:substrate-binding domain-containing protein [Parasporobacterium sp.]
MKPRINRISFLLFLLTGLLLFLSACGMRRPDSNQYKVFLIAKSTQTEFWKSVFAGANAAKTEYNMDLHILGPETEEDYEGQNALIQQAVKEGADAIVFSAISYTNNAPSIDEAARSGVKVIVIDSDVDSSLVSARIGTDNIQAGRMTASAVLEVCPDPMIVGIVNFAQVSKNGEEREKGLREELEKDPRTGKLLTINVITGQEEALQETIRFLQEHPEINTLVALNEPLAVGAALAVDDLDLSDSVRLVAFDSNPICIDKMREGVVSALIVQNPFAMGYLGVEAAWKLLEGQTFNPDRLIDTSTTIITPETMFTEEGQKALFFFQ